MAVSGQLDDQAHPVPVRLVPQVADALDLLIAHEPRDLLDDPHFISLVRNLGKDDLDAVACGRFFQVLLRPDRETAAAGTVQPLEILPILTCKNRACGGKVGALHMFHDVGEGRVLTTEHRLHRSGKLGQVVRRDVAGHGHSDPGGAIQQQVRRTARQDRWLVERLIKIGREIDCALVQIGEQLFGDPREPRFRITHRRRWIVIDRSKVTLPVDQRVAQREVLRHPYHRVVDRLIGVRMILAKYFTDDPGRFSMRLVGAHAQVVHCIENAALDGLEAVARVGQRARHDHAHGVIEIGRTHLLDERARGLLWNRLLTNQASTPSHYV